MEKRIKYILGISILALVILLFVLSFGINVNQTISFEEAKSIATNQISSLFSGRAWDYIDGKLLYDYKGNPARYYFLFVQKDSNISISSFGELNVLIPNISKCQEDNFCGNNFATLSVRAYKNSISRGDRNIITRHYGWIPFFISDKIEIEKNVLSKFPNKKFGREIVFVESSFEPVYYTLIDKEDTIDYNKLSKNTLIIKPSGSGGNFSVLTISEFLEGNSKIAKEMEGAKVA